jgi:lipopolysaccharide biosynthesis glycosyltransferase
MRGTRGLWTVTTLDRLDDLRRMLTSLWKHNKVQVQVMMARDWLGAHELKARAGMLSAFDATVMMDTDIYVNGDISELFRIAESGKLAIYRHLNQGHWNSGVVAFNRELGIRLSQEWTARRFQIAAGYTSDKEAKTYYRTDQKSLNEIIDKYPVYSLPATYNYIIPERTLEAEAMDWDRVKVFHFLHKACRHRTSSRSWKLYNEL